jgi:hypothetical protein
MKATNSLTKATGLILVIDTIADALDLGGTEVGAGMNISSNLQFTGNDTGRFAFVFGQGIQNYMNDAPVNVGIELTRGGDPRRPIKGVALPMWSMVAFLDHNWSKRFMDHLVQKEEKESHVEKEDPDQNARRGVYGDDIRNRAFIGPGAEDQSRRAG